MRINRLLPALVALVLAACGPGVEPPHLLWSADAQSLDNPFPDARMVQADGVHLRSSWYQPFLLRVNGNLRSFFDGYISQAQAEVHGLGNFGPVLLRPSEPVDPATLSGTVARLRKTAAGYEVLEANVAVEHSTDVLTGTSVTASAAFPEFIVARPSVPLPEGDEGLLVVKKGIKTKAGALLGRGFEFDGDEARPDLKAAAKALGIKEEEIVLALPQKPTPVSPDLDAINAFVDSADGLAQVTIPPRGMVTQGQVTRPVGRWQSTDAEWGTMLFWLERDAYAGNAAHVGEVVVGSLAARDLRDSGVWNKAWVADPKQAPVVPLGFVLAVPVGPKPAGGWPLVIAQHGLGGRNVPVNGDTNSYCLENAEILAEKGVACLGIDAPSHGLRGNFLEFFTVENLPEIRDTFREMTFDLLQVARAAPGIDYDGDGQPDFQPEVGYLGNSLGSIMGSAFVPVAQRIKYAVLNVPGAGLSNILVSNDIRDRIGLLICAKTGIGFGSEEYYAGFPAFRTVAQAFLEPADPINIAARMSADRALLVQEGVGDLTIPNFTTENLATAMQLPVPTSEVSGATPQHALYRVDPAKFLPADQLVDFNGHNVFGAIEPVRTQAVRFLQSKGQDVLVP